MEPPEPTWEDVLSRIIDDSHLVTGDQLSTMVDGAVRPLGLTAEVLVVDLAQQVLTPVQPRPGEPVAVEGTIAGRAYQLGEIHSSGEGGSQGGPCGYRCSTGPTGPACCESGFHPTWSTTAYYADGAGCWPACSVIS